MADSVGKLFSCLKKCQANNEPPYENLYYISGVIERIFHKIKISFFTMYSYRRLKFGQYSAVL